MTRSPRTLSYAQYDENCQNWPKLTFKWPATANFPRNMRNWYDIWNKRIKLHQRKSGERNFGTKNLKRGPPSVRVCYPCLPRRRLRNAWKIISEKCPSLQLGRRSSERTDNVACVFIYSNLLIHPTATGIHRIDFPNYRIDFSICWWHLTVRTLIVRISCEILSEHHRWRHKPDQRLDFDHLSSLASPGIEAIPMEKCKTAWMILRYFFSTLQTYRRAFVPSHLKAIVHCGMAPNLSHPESRNQIRSSCIGDARYVIGRSCKEHENGSKTPLGWTKMDKKSRNSEIPE